MSPGPVPASNTAREEPLSSSASLWKSVSGYGARRRYAATTDGSWKAEAVCGPKYAGFGSIGRCPLPVDWSFSLTFRFSFARHPYATVTTVIRHTFRLLPSPGDGTERAGSPGERSPLGPLTQPGKHLLSML